MLQGSGFAEPGHSWGVFYISIVIAFVVAFIVSFFRETE